jgi:pyridoxal phosphate enzyme (YggS family)
MSQLNRYQRLLKEIDFMHNSYKHCYKKLVTPITPRLLVVTKGQDFQKILPLLNHGHINFGENKVQEAFSKWTNIKSLFQNIKLHMIGQLQTNKAKQAIELFDVIESLDRLSLASILLKEMQKQNKYPEIYIQINISEEEQKSGISPREASNFIQACKNLGLKISGVMGIAPSNKPTFPYFALLREIAIRNSIEQISMGMSNDFGTAIRFGCTQVRIGSAIFFK